MNSLIFKKYSDSKMNHGWYMIKEIDILECPFPMNTDSKEYMDRLILWEIKNNV